MPEQKPGRSEQVVATPPDFLEAVKTRLGISEFAMDLAADENNTVSVNWIGEEEDSLSEEVKWTDPDVEGWCWLNPPYSHIEPWVEKAWVQSQEGAKLAVLIPASVGANWWRDWVRGKAYVTYLNNRIKFVGHKDLYPKDLALLLYAPFLEGGSCMWRWR